MVQVVTEVALAVGACALVLLVVFGYVYWAAAGDRDDEEETMIITRQQLLLMIDGIFSAAEAASIKIGGWEGAILVGAEKAANSTVDNNIDLVIAELAKLGITVTG